MEKEKLTSQIDAFLIETDKFLLSINISKTNIIDVFIDGDTGVTIQDCIDLARAIEGEYDRDVEDFELRVSSIGVDKEFKLIRQLKKYIGKEIEFYLPNEKPFKAKLLSINENVLKVEQESGKGKKKEIVTKEIDFESAEKIKPLVKFK